SFPLHLDPPCSTRFATVVVLTVDSQRREARQASGCSIELGGGILERSSARPPTPLDVGGNLGSCMPGRRRGLISALSRSAHRGGCPSPPPCSPSRCTPGRPRGRSPGGTGAATRSRR